MSLADSFDAPLASREHAWLRDELWLGGPLLEGPYLLGRLLQHNFFQDTQEAFKVALHRHFASTFSDEVATVLSSNGIELGVRVLRCQCQRFEDIPLNKANRREAEAMAALAKKPSMTDADLAAHLQTTIKQVKRLSYLKLFRRMIR